MGVFGFSPPARFGWEKDGENEDLRAQSARKSSFSLIPPCPEGRGGRGMGATIVTECTLKSEILMI
jgi:hypothetical protein